MTECIQIVDPFPIPSHTITGVKKGEGISVHNYKTSREGNTVT